MGKEGIAKKITNFQWVYKYPRDSTAMVVNNSGRKQIDESDTCPAYFIDLTIDGFKGPPPFTLLIKVSLWLKKFNYVSLIKILL